MNSYNLNPSSFSSDAVKKAERLCFDSGISPQTLMNNAAHAVYNCISAKANGKTERVTVVCGKGNNGGDGYAIGVIMLEKGYDVEIIYTTEPVTEEALHFWDEYLDAGGIALKYSEDENAAVSRIFSSTLIIDALFGIGFKGSLSGDALSLVNAVNESEGFVVSVDIPSGLSADTGFCEGKNVAADITCTFSVKKNAHLVFPAAGYCGEVVVCDIGIPGRCFDDIDPDMTVSDSSVISSLLPRPVNSHKGTYGTLKALVGSPSMPGAAVMSIRSALRSGVGLVRAFSDNNTVDVIRNNAFEAIAGEYISAEDFLSVPSSAVMIGCGIGREYDDDLFEILTEEKSPVVIDADGINFVSENIDVLSEREYPTILTPHPGEMARLLGQNVSYVQKYRMECASHFASECRCIVVLKGANTVIADENGELYVNVTGNNGLAKGGSGDVLTGIIASLCAQGNSPLLSARAGVYVHGKTADELKKTLGERGMLPTDIIENLPYYLK